MVVLSTESKTVEEPLIKYAKQIGWIYISPKEAIQLRRGETGKLFYSILRESLIKLNASFLNEGNVDGLVQKIDNISDTMEGNRENLNWIRGQKVFFDEKEKRNKNVIVIDFLNPENNVFQVTQQWSYTNPRKTNRPDVMFLINGIPFAIVENKKPGMRDSMEKAIEQLKRLERETPEIMSHPQVFNVTDAFQYFYGATWNYSRKGIFNWKKEQQGQRTKKISLEEAVITFFEKNHFLKIIKDWVLFYYKENELQKTILKQHQTRAVEKVIKRCDEPSKKRALIWHTQGSGKTFTMLTSARLILESNTQATVMIIVDRNELEGQLSTWVNRIIKELKTSGVLIEQAHSKKDLQELLKSDFRGLVISMLHKFKDIPANICKRDNFYIFIDEAHRSVEGDLGNYLTGALPNATLIGFTGTPIDKTSKGRGTFKVFGKDDKQGYLDKYSIAESIDDGTTVKLRHSLAPNKMRVTEELLEKEFFQIADTEGISDIDTLNKVLKRSVTLRTFLKSSKRIDEISQWMAKHFTENIQPLGYKAFVVAVDREACALYKKALDKYLSPEVSKVVYTKGLNDSELLQQHQLDKWEEGKTRKLFTKEGHNPQILIVTDKLLTGYDAPILYCMYLDKPMRDHVLLQAIARVNRPYEDKEGRRKPCGLIIDFVGIFKSLKKALSFDSEEVNAVIEDLDCLMKKFKSMMETDIKPYLSVTAKGADKLLEKLVYETLLDPKEREKFFNQFKELETLYEILSPDEELRPYIDDYKNIVELYRVVRNTYKDKVDFISDICKKTEKLVKQATDVNIFSGITKTYEINEDTLKKIKENQDTELENKKVINLIRSIQKESEEKSKQEPYLISISERSRRIMKEFENKQKTSKEALDSAMKLTEEKINIQKMRKQSSLSYQEFTIAWPLKKSGISNFEELAIQINESFDKFKNFYSNSDEKRQLKMDMYKILSSHISDDKLVAVSTEIIESVEETKK
ncbi:MAG: HsdR family type I site-specific deoxyribonuclease [Bdellovibrionales bacterium]|nr:HsdR family type I site-specific deoxyribonuclease [Bdellovibrionales bacterium]